MRILPSPCSPDLVVCVGVIIVLPIWLRGMKMKTMKPAGVEVTTAVARVSTTRGARWRMKVHVVSCQHLCLTLQQWQQQGWRQQQPKPKEQSANKRKHAIQLGPNCWIQWWTSHFRWWRDDTHHLSQPSVPVETSLRPSKATRQKRQLWGHNGGHSTIKWCGKHTAIVADVEKKGKRMWWSKWWWRKRRRIVTIFQEKEVVKEGGRRNNVGALKLMF